MNLGSFSSKNSHRLTGAKTTEVTKLQVGDEPKEIKIVVSTVAEAEHLSDYLLDQKEHGKSVHVSNLCR